VYGYLDNSETPKNKDYQKIKGQLDGLMEALPTEEDRQILSKMVSNSYYKYYESIKSMEKDDPSLISPLIMALLVDQISMIERLEDN
jgi:hypothetical protein